MESYEKLGVFYLGRSYDLSRKETTDELLLYDSKDLLTHAFCVGMTGSGKTGLCVTLLEEAAIDGIPALVIDPKGDLTNLMLTFPDLSAADFRPWINEDAANRKGMTPDAYAESQAKLWRDGLASWQQDGERIKRLRQSAECTIYTPGSEAGQPVSILDSFAAPPPEIRNDNDLFNERIVTTATSLLSLLEIDADPLKSREHILVSTILEKAWESGTNLDLPALIQAIQDPPVARIGVFELDSFFPAKDRFELAMTLNNLLASPSFETWLTGTPLDIDQLLYTPEGKPRISIFSIAHLSDTERMFFVSLLFNQILGWMRTRPGTTSLRALLYMDEIFGYIPPVANPPSKKPLLTLLKQARAYGVGVVLATQNPVDLDYKGLSNTGTWFIGRLQTDRDKERVLDGLEGVAAGSTGAFDRRKMEQLLAGLGQRVFLMHNVHDDGPTIFHTRWALSYLCGPLTRLQIKELMKPQLASAAARKIDSAAATASISAPPVSRPAAETKAKLSDGGAARPVLPPDIPQVFLPLRQSPAGKELVYQPGIIGAARVHFVQKKNGVEHVEESLLLIPIDEQTTGIDWNDADELPLDRNDLLVKPSGDANYAPISPQAGHVKSYSSWKQSLTDMLYRSRRHELFASAAFKAVSEPGESERDFRIRLAELAREQRDATKEKLRKKYEPQLRTIEDRITQAELMVDREKEQSKQQKLQTVISVGATMLSAFLGKKKTSRSTLGRATTAARGMSRSAKEAQDIARARTKLDRYKQRLIDLQLEFEDEIDKMDDRFDPQSAELETVALKPRKADVDVELVALAWLPCLRSEKGGLAEPAWS
jgi:hypothetical protein